MQQAISVLFSAGIFIILIGLWLYKKEHQMLTELERRLDSKEQSLLEIYEGVEEIINEIQFLYSPAVNSAEREAVNVNHTDISDYMANYDADDKDTLFSEAEDGINDEIIEINRRKADEINILLDQGTLTDQEIASELKIGLGEVMLIKSLGKRRQ